MEFARGDKNYHTFAMPAAGWTPNGTLFFTAKPGFDDDATDSSALIKGKFTDVNLLPDIIYGGVTYKKYACKFPGSATSGVASNGAASIDLLGEFQFKPLNDDPTTYPEDDENKIPVTLFFDITVRTS